MDGDANISTSNSNDSAEKDLAVITAAEVKPETELEANIQLKKLEKKHRWDPNLPRELVDGIDEATAHHDVNQELKLVDQLVENSPYPEVRAAVRNVSTLRGPSSPPLLTPLMIDSMTKMSLQTPSVLGL